MSTLVNSPMIAANQPERIWYWIIFGLGVSWTIYLMVNSSGVYLHDEVGHFLYSKNAWEYPELMLDTWGRPINTILYMIPALWGLTAARIFSLIMAILTVWFTTKLAAISGVQRYYLIPLLLWFQPWFNDFSYQAITEVPFSFCMVLGVVLWLTARETTAAIVLGLLPLIRHEGIVLAGMFGLYMLFRKQWLACILTLLPLAAYNLVYFIVWKDWPFSIFLDVKPTELYGSGSWFHFFPRLVYRAGIPVILLALLGSLAVWKHRYRFRYLAGYLTYFIVHTVIYRFGLFSSGGYTIFLLPLAPAIAIMAALGGETLLNHLATTRANQKVLSYRSLQTLIPVAALSILVIGFTSRPHPLDEEGLAMQEAVQWIHENIPSEKSIIISSHVWFHYYYDLPWGEWGLPVELEKLPDSSLVLWDRNYSESWGIHKAYLSDTLTGWHKLADFHNGIAVLFQKSISAGSNVHRDGLR